MNRADRSVAMPWMTSGWALISETGVGVEDLGVRGCLNSLNSFEFGPISLGELPSELASPRTADTTDSTVECRTPAMIRVPTDCTDKDIQRMDSVLSTSSGDAVALPTPTTPVTRGQLRAGPGFQFARNADGRITIGAIAPGGPASAEGSLAVGDELLSVDGLECARASAREVRAAILGDQGSTVSLKVFRSLDRRTFVVSLARGSTEGWSLSDKLKDMENQVKEKDATIRLLRLQLASEHDREVRFDDDVITGTGEATSTAAGTGHGNAIHDSLSRCMDLQRDSMSDNAGQPDVKGSPIPASELAMKSSIPGAENAMSTEEVHHLEKSVNQLHNCTAAMPYEFHLVQTEVHSHSDQDNDSNTTRGSLPLDVVRVQKQLDETQQHLTSRLNDTKQQLAGANILLTEKGRMIESLEHERDIEQNRVDEIEEQLADANMLLADKSRMLESMLQQRAIESPVISPSEDVSSSLIAPLCAENASIISVLREMLDVTKSMVEAAEESKLVETFHTNTDLGRRNNMCGTDGFEISSSGKRTNGFNPTLSSTESMTYDAVIGLFQSSSSQPEAPKHPTTPPQTPTQSRSSDAGHGRGSGPMHGVSDCKVNVELNEDGPTWVVLRERLRNLEVELEESKTKIAVNERLLGAAKALAGRHVMANAEVGLLLADTEDTAQSLEHLVSAIAELQELQKAQLQVNDARYKNACDEGNTLRQILFEIRSKLLAFAKEFDGHASVDSLDDLLDRTISLAKQENSVGVEKEALVRAYAIERGELESKVNFSQRQVAGLQEDRAKLQRVVEDLREANQKSEDTIVDLESKMRYLRLQVQEAQDRTNLSYQQIAYLQQKEGTLRGEVLALRETCQQFTNQALNCKDNTETAEREGEVYKPEVSSLTQENVAIGLMFDDGDHLNRGEKKHCQSSTSSTNETKLQQQVLNLQRQVLKNLEVSALREEVLAVLHAICNELKDEVEEIHGIALDYEAHSTSWREESTAFRERVQVHSTEMQLTREAWRRAVVEVARLQIKMIAKNPLQEQAVNLDKTAGANRNSENLVADATTLEPESCVDSLVSSQALSDFAPTGATGCGSDMKEVDSMEALKRGGIDGQGIAEKRAMQGTRRAVLLSRGATGGVGLVLDRPAEFAAGPFVIHRVIAGGVAEQCNQIFLGDFLHEIDGVSVHPMSLDQMKSMILGNPGQPITLTVSTPMVSAAATEQQHGQPITKTQNNTAVDNPCCVCQSVRLLIAEILGSVEGCMIDMQRLSEGLDKQDAYAQWNFSVFQNELARFHALPSPVGVGIRIGECKVESWSSRACYENEVSFSRSRMLPEPSEALEVTAGAAEVRKEAPGLPTRPLPDVTTTPPNATCFDRSESGSTTFSFGALAGEKDQEFENSIGWKALGASLGNMLSFPPALMESVKGPSSFVGTQQAMNVDGRRSGDVKHGGKEKAHANVDGDSVQNVPQNVPQETGIPIIVIEELVPYMAAHMSGVLQVGMQVLEVDDVSVCNKTLTSINAMIAGERGSVVKLKVKAINKDKPFCVFLKRGSWGPEHACVEIEAQDMHIHTDVQGPWLGLGNSMPTEAADHLLVY